MNKIVSILLISFLFIQSSKASDTTSARILFGWNEYKIAETEKNLLDDIIPSDTSIVLQKIRIYGYCDSAETENKKNPLSLLRANEVKQYLLNKGIKPSLIMEVAGKGKLGRSLTDSSGQLNRSVLVLIDYDSRVIEQTIIIKSSPKKKED